jgi:hypothetical protein
VSTAKSILHLTPGPLDKLETDLANARIVLQLLKAAVSLTVLEESNSMATTEAKWDPTRARSHRKWSGQPTVATRLL